MKKLTVVAASAAIVASFASANVMAGESPFGMKELSTGYNVAMSEGTCGEGKCGANKDGETKDGKAKDGKCGANKDGKTKEGKCGGES